jgi:hypothetical protein
MPVYFARAGSDGLVKIGFSRHVAARIAKLATFSPVPLTILRVIEGDYQVEAWLHRHFSRLRRNGEWFEFCDDMLTIEPPMLKGGPGAPATFRDIVGFWPSLDAMAADARTTVGAIKQWRNRDKIPGEYWAAVAAAADRRGLPVTLEVLADLSAKKAA